MDQNLFKYDIKGLSCSNCANKIEASLKNHNYKQVKVNFATRSLMLASNDLKGINKIIAQIEPDAIAIPVEATKSTETMFKDPQIVQIAISIILLLMGLMFIQSPSNALILFLGYIFLFLAYLTAGWKVLWKAIKQIRNYDFTNEHFLMSIATAGAILIQQVPEAVAVMVFYTIGEFLQTKAINHSRNSIKTLLDIRPDQAHLIKDDQIVTISTSEAQKGDLILIKPGERVPLDGILLKGSASLDMSVLTGESRPITVQPGMEVLSGSITNNSIHIQVTSSSQESTVTRILNAVETAASNKSKTELFITRFSRYYTPLVLVIAILIALLPPLLFGDHINEWIYRALVVLVISCPCALVVSIPLVYFSAIGKSSREGILFKGANVIDKLNNTSSVLWDKTGTLTIGKFKVVTIVPTKGYTAQEVLSYAALAEAHSNHPIAISIREAYSKPIDSTLIEEYEEIPALGIKMRTSSNEEIIVGNDKMVHEFNCEHSKCIIEETVVYVILNQKYIGHLIIDDQIKPDSIEAIQKLRKLSINDTAILTGDTKNIAEKVGRELGIGYEQVFSSLMPLNKLEILEKYIKEKPNKGMTVFVGDGINDAPVIARADIGVAMGGIGSDATIEAADLVIMDDNPSKLALAIEISRKTTSVAKQNIILAIGIKSLFILLGTLGIASMWAAVFGDVGVTIITVFNSLRLLR